ncbi:outer membrane biosynthesis protein TonB [Sphingomonas melonis]|uniref:Outer membrane biosynthesis protein TonB n=2 Tax=Sphingomonas melonis TaxID=152682 RepID=A0A7Y9FN59_9SPHN|nr:outer membrane biosynthesis protein TonB [Sphingomonas melonis]
MNMKRGARLSAIALLLAGAAAGPGVAQTSNTTAPQTIPGLDNFSLPPSQQAPTPAPTPPPEPLPVPVVTPTPRVAATPAARPTPRPGATPTPRATPSPTPTPTATPTSAPAAAAPVIVATPTVEPSPTPSATPSPVASPSTVPADTAATSAGPSNGWWWAGAALLAIAAAAGWWLLRRRGAGVAEFAPEPAPEMAPPPVPPVRQPTPRPAAPQAPAPAMLAPEPPMNRARLALTLHPRRAGLNLLSATVEAELEVRNLGTAPASAIRIGTTLTDAGPGQEGDVAALFAVSVGRPAVPPFALAPGETRRVRIVAALPRTSIRPLEAAGRPMFVPIVAINALYDAGGVEGQNAAAFAIGVERVDSAKLAPFWLDQPPRMYDALGVRPYAAAVER